MKKSEQLLKNHRESPKSPTWTEVDPHKGRIIQSASGVNGSGKTTVTYTDGETQTLRGPRPIRNNNPGNLEYGEFAKKLGAVGSDGRFAVFPTVQDGYNAKVALLKTEKYQNLSIREAFDLYAPPHENPNYLRDLKKFTGLDLQSPMRALSKNEFDTILQAVATIEGHPYAYEVAHNTPPKTHEPTQLAASTPPPSTPTPSPLQTAKAALGLEDLETLVCRIEENSALLLHSMTTKERMEAWGTTYGQNASKLLPKDLNLQEVPETPFNIESRESLFTKKTWEKIRQAEEQVKPEAQPSFSTWAKNPNPQKDYFQPDQTQELRQTLQNPPPLRPLPGY